MFYGKLISIMQVSVGTKKFNAIFDTDIAQTNKRRAHSAAKQQIIYAHNTSNIVHNLTQYRVDMKQTFIISSSVFNVEQLNCFNTLISIFIKYKISKLLLKDQALNELPCQQYRRKYGNVRRHITKFSSNVKCSPVLCKQTYANSVLSKQICLKVRSIRTNLI